MDGFISEFGGVCNGFFRRNIYLKRDDSFVSGVEAHIEEFNNTDIYYGVYNYETDNINECKLYGSFYIDLDIDIEDELSFKKVNRDAILAIQYLEDYFKIPRDMFQVYFSGAKGFHVIIPAIALGVVPHKDLNKIFKAIAINVIDEMKCTTIDTRIYDRKRLFRIPNSINSKTGLYKVPVPIPMMWHCTLNYMKEWAKEPREIHFTPPQVSTYGACKFHTIIDIVTKNKEKPDNNEKKEFLIPTTPKPLLPCVKEILSVGSQKGQRNNTTVALASALMQSGKQLEEVIEILEEWNELNDPPLDEKELCTTATSAYQMLHAGKTYGCAVFKEIGTCIGKECKLNN